MNPYLSFAGNCREAFELYAQVLGGTIESAFPYVGSPMEKDAPPDWGNKLIHATLRTPAGVLMGADPPPGRYEAPKGFSIHFVFGDAAEAERVFNALSGGATIHMPLQKTFWSPCFGMLVDRFGIPWMINCEGGQQ